MPAIGKYRNHYLFIYKVAPIVLHRSNTPEHERYLDQGDAGGKVQLVKEQLTEEDAGKHQPVAQRGQAMIGPYVCCHGVIGWHHQAEKDFQQQIGLSHSGVKPCLSVKPS